MDYLRTEGKAGRLGERLLAIVAEGNRSRLYLPPNDGQIAAARVARPIYSVDGEIADNPRWFSPPVYGLTHFADLFTSRQLVALTTFSNLVGEARGRVLEDAMAAGRPKGARLEAGGSGAAAYADSVAAYLGIAVSRYADLSNSMCSWNQQNENVRALFARQAIPMAWDFVEAEPFGRVGLSGPIESVVKALNVDPRVQGVVVQRAAQETCLADGIISTDPPYYDNIGYSDLSDFFYVWLRRSLRTEFPDLFSTVLVPKSDELVANPYRHQGKEGAKRFFEEGFRKVFANARAEANPDFPITVYYAFKQAESSDEGTFLNWLGDAARWDDSVWVGDHGDVADAK